MTNLYICNGIEHKYSQKQGSMSEINSRAAKLIKDNSCQSSHQDVRVKETTHKK